MAIKVTLVAALLVALVALACATTYTTTVTTTAMEDEANPSRLRKCRRQLQGRQFRSCQRYISDRRDPYEEDVLEMTTEMNPKQQEEHLRECCQQLRNVDEQCQCEAIRHVVREVQQEEGSQQLQKLHERVRELPRRCGLRAQRCEFRVVFV